MDINTTATANPVDMYGMMNSLAVNPMILGIVVIVVLIYLLFFSSFGGGDAAAASSSAGFFGNTPAATSSSASSATNGPFFVIIAIIILLFLAAKVLQYFFSVNVTASLANLFSPKPQLDVTVDQSAYKAAPVPEIRFRNQVYNLPGQKYTYEDAKAVCQAYGSRLATYDEVEKTYAHGGEWCNYGWSDGQMALFPTQQRTYDAFQKQPGHEHDCGRPGINGGYIPDAKQRFGVNCYGHKPKITQEESNIMHTVPPYPVTMKDVAYQHRVDYWKDKLTEILVSPFNHKIWSQII